MIGVGRFLSSVSPGGNPLTQWLPSVRFICAKGFPPGETLRRGSRPDLRTYDRPDVDGRPSRERGAGRFRGLVFGGTFGGNKADPSLHTSRAIPSKTSEDQTLSQRRIKRLE
jgi:hypothetical protein